ncbi:nuclear transport factor 2 family protein [Flavimarina sp. Hel_I_48]|uniref:nuclear transport factor 2 family protein n=1 Tax=Flavimarina sp. Hel_I_48 TaxID=1392488 RepID=UPI00068B0C44|nr:nuclear transport factor 2 family protein [Flavimarina sp. Hel_I_48]
MTNFRPFLAVFFLFLCCFCNAQEKTSTDQDIAKMLDAWHDAAARADYDAYFDLMAKDAIFIGTDADENWQNMEFKAFARPYFDRGKAWSFTALERNIYSSENQNIAWFDELLDTQMGICRGSGVVIKMDNTWKIKHYVLSITVPNEQVEALTTLKEEHDKDLIVKLKD